MFQLDLTSLDLALSILKSVCYGAQTIYNDEVLSTGELVEHVVSTSSAIIQGIMMKAQKLDTFLENMYKLMIQEVMDSVERLVLVLYFYLPVKTTKWIRYYLSACILMCVYKLVYFSYLSWYCLAHSFRKEYCFRLGAIVMQVYALIKLWVGLNLHIYEITSLHQNED